MALDRTHLLRIEAAFVEAPQVRAVGLAGVDVAGMFREEAQEGAVPDQRAVVLVECAHRDVQPIQRRGDRSEKVLRIGHRRIVNPPGWAGQKPRRPARFRVYSSRLPVSPNTASSDWNTL